MTKNKPANIEAELLRIARRNLNPDLENFSRRGRDSLDFFEVSIIGVRDALLAAYELGRSESNNKKSKRKEQA